MTWQNLSRNTAIILAGLFMATYQFAPTPSWACSAGGSGATSYGSTTSATAVTVCAKAVVTAKTITPAKPAPAPVLAPVTKSTPKPVAKPAPAQTKKPVAPVLKVPAPLVLLTPIKVGVPKVLQKPKVVVPVAPKPIAKPVTKSVPVSSVAAPKAATASSASTALAEVSFSPAALVIFASDSSISQGTSVSFSTSAKLHYKSGSLLGKAVDVQFQPTQTSWVFGDGSVGAGSSVKHQFWAEGTFSISASVTYAVAYQVAGTSVWTDSGLITVGDSASIVVSSTGDSATPESPDESAKVVRIVGKNCFENPGSFGCTL